MPLRTAHTDRISSEALARVGLPTALAPTRASKIRFETPVGATARSGSRLDASVAMTDARKPPFETAWVAPQTRATGERQAGRTPPQNVTFR